jgi:hypothetical protein
MRNYLKSLKVFLILILLFFASSVLADKIKYETCLKWVNDAVGVECKSHHNKPSIGSVIFYKKVDKRWVFYTRGTKYPFHIFLKGAGLSGGTGGGTVTKYGYKACNKFCKKHKR